MSSTIVPVATISEIKPHPNADRLDIATVLGWQCVVGRGVFKPGDLITYIPPDCVLPDALAESLGVAKYLSKGRVRATRLRGEPSFGIVAPPHGNEGDNVAELLGITKYVPPLRLSAGDAEADHPLFVKYTDIENMRNFPDVFSDGEAVVVTEKIHGTNSRVGLIDGEWMAGSKTVRRKDAPNSTYWHPLRQDAVHQLICTKAHGQQVILFGEVYGKVQSLRYGLPNGIAYRAFDMLVDGKYLDAETFAAECARFGVERAPELYRGPFSIDKIKELSNGQSMIPGANNIREGVVVRPVTERTHPKIGRVILKYVGDDYLCGGNDDAGE